MVAFYEHFRNKDKLIVKAELLGLEAKDVNVSVSGDLLTFKGDKVEAPFERVF